MYRFAGRLSIYIAPPPKKHTLYKHIQHIQHTTYTTYTTINILINILIDIMTYITYMVRERQGGGGGDIHREVSLISG